MPPPTTHLLPSITQAAAEDDRWWREAPAAAAPARAQAAPRHGSLLDSLLGSALGERPHTAAVAVRLPPALPPHSPPAAAPPHSAPGAPRRLRSLPPPPTVPASVLAPLRHASTPAALFGGGSDGSEDDTACSHTASWQDGSAASATAALDRANAWLRDIARMHSTA